MTDSTQPQDTELFELCEEVYAKTVWDNHQLRIHSESLAVAESFGTLEYSVPLYTSDYLLEKLPISVESEWSHSGNNELTIVKLDGKYSASYLHSKEDRVALVGSTNLIGVADTPLKALLKLVLTLDDAGVKLA